MAYKSESLLEQIALAAETWLADIKKQRVLSRVGQDSNGLGLC